MDSVELFTGCGGLAMGLSRAGFRSQRMCELDKHSVTNILHNRQRGIRHVVGWPIFREDVRTVDWSQFLGIDLVAGGPPCQPFSIGGLHGGDADRRDMWPEAIRAVREARPRAFLFENVRGLVRASFESYLRWVLCSLALPQFPQRQYEDRNDYVTRLENLRNRALYRLRLVQVNAADFGAPQKRHRVIIMGLRSDIGEWPDPPNPTHSRDRLVCDKWITGGYWRRHSLRVPKCGPSADEARSLERLRHTLIVPNTNAWVTVRDAIAGLGEPDRSAMISNHVLQEGARSYPGHTGSPLDEPAKALKAGVHGVPGGENMMALSNGKVRYFTVREATRLQGLPDDYEFVGSWSENMRQLGNAVPSQLAEAFGSRMRNYLSGPSQRVRAA